MAESKFQIIVSEIDDFTDSLSGIGKGLTGVQNKLESMKSTFSGMAKWGTVAYAAISAEVWYTIDAFAESEAQIQRVDSILANLSAETLAQFSGGMQEAQQIAYDFGAELQNMGGIGDEAASEGFAKLLQVTGDVSSAMEYATLAADLATAK